MTISVTSALAGPFAANGVTTVFPFAFKAMSAAELEVRLTVSGVESVVDPSAYTVALNTGEGGAVTFLTAPVTGTVAILGDPDFGQQVSFTNAGAFLPAVVDQALDRMAVRELSLKRDVGRAIKAPLGESGPTYPAAADRAGYYLTHDEDGSIVPGISAGELDGMSSDISNNAAAISVESAARVAGDAGEAQARIDGDARVLAAVAAAGTPLATVTIPVTSRASLQALSTAIGLRANFDGSSWDLTDYSAVSAAVTADTAQGLFVRSTYDTSKVWKRVIFTEVWFHWFGAIQGNNSGGNAATNNAAWTAMQSALAALAVNISSNFQGLYEIRIGLGTYEGSTVWELTKGSTILRGCGMGHYGSTVVTGGTRLKFYGSGGLRTQATNTSGISTGDAVTHTGGDGCDIRDLGIEGDGLVGGTAEAEYYGLHIRCQTFIQNVAAVNFAGECFRIEASTSGVKGNASNSHLLNCHGWGGRIGFLTVGNNTGVCKFTNCTSNNCRAWGFDSQGSIGCTYDNCESSNNGTVAANDGITIGASCVAYTGGDSVTRRYFVISGQETGASTNAPSGTTADNAYWSYYQTAGAASGVPGWVSGMLIRAGGCYRSAGSSKYTGCYAEVNNQGKFQGLATDSVDGGKLQNWCFTGGTGANAFTLWRAGSNGMATTYVAWQVFSGTVEARLGDQNGNTLNRIWYGSEPTYAPSAWACFINAASGDLIHSYASSTTNYSFRHTGPSSTTMFGRTAAVTLAVHCPKFFLGSSTANGREITNNTAAPTSGENARGDVIINRSMSAGGSPAWGCTTGGTAGSTAVYKTFAAMAA